MTTATFDEPHASDRGTARERGEDLCAVIDASPSPFHAVRTLASRLEAAGFTELRERDRWTLSPGDQRYVVREGSIVALRVGSAPAAEAGVRLVGAHTDSPTYRLRPNPDVRREGYAQVGVEVYGGPLHHTWLDRDLTVAGRVVTADGEEVLVHLPGAPLRIPSLAIHLHRGVNEEGLTLNPQQHLLPVLSAAVAGASVGELVAEASGLSGPGQIAAADLVLADTQPSALGGLHGEFVLAPRQDNLVSCYAAVEALVAAGATVAPPAVTQVVVCNDHEEVGSGSAEGARGAMLEQVLGRLLAATGDADPQALPRAIASSLLVSCDSAHAVHPNYADKHDGGHRPRLGGGPVVKVHASQAYATDAGTAAHFQRCCRRADVPVQVFTNRADQPSGSTIGPLTATRLGLATVDVGNPLLSMHSIREQSAAADLAHLVAALTVHLAG